MIACDLIPRSIIYYAFGWLIHNSLLGLNLILKNPNIAHFKLWAYQEPGEFIIEECRYTCCHMAFRKSANMCKAA